MMSQAETKGAASWSKTIRSYSPESNTPSARVAGSAFKLGAAVLPDHGHREAGLPSSGDLPGHRRPRIAGHTTQPNDRDGPVPTAGNFRTHVTSETRIMFQAIGRHVSLPTPAGIAALFNPRFTASTLRLMGAKGRTLSPLFRNTVTPTSVRAATESCPTSRRSC